MSQKRKILLYSTILSLILHGLILSISGLNLIEFKLSDNSKDHPLHNFKLRKIGYDDGKRSQDLMFNILEGLKENPKTVVPEFTPFNAIDLSTVDPSKRQKKKIKKKPLLRKKAISKLSTDNESIKTFLKSSAFNIQPNQYIRALKGSESSVKIGLPKGIKEDELNDEEMVFFSFKKRLAISYANAVFSKINEFERTNPHIAFPIANSDQQMTGRITYDKDGQIIRIKMLKWTEVEKLQEFFLEVLKDLHTMPNPPKEIVKDGEFNIYYTFSVKT